MKQVTKRRVKLKLHRGKNEYPIVLANVEQAHSSHIENLAQPTPSCWVTKLQTICGLSYASTSGVRLVCSAFA